MTRLNRMGQAPYTEPRTLPTSVVITGTNASDFTVLGSPGGSVIAANGGGGVTLALDINFIPGANGLRGPATVTILSDDAFGNDTFTFAIQGTGVGPDISIQNNGNPVVDGALLADTSATNGTDFGTRISSINANFFIANTGTADLSLGNISLSGSSQFTITSDPSNTIINPSGGANVSETLQITFNPVGTGQQTATVTILNDEPDEDPFTFVIEGVADAPQEIRVTGGALSGEVFNGDGIPQTSTINGTDFGTVALGSDLNTNFYIINDGIAGLLVTGSVTRTSGSSAFTVSSQPSINSSIAFGFSKTLQINFTPPTGPNGSVHTAVFSIPNNDSDENPFTFTVSGTISAPDMRVTGNGQLIVDGDPSPDPANDTDFGSQTVNTTTSITYTVYNDGGEDLSPSNVSVSGTNAGEFVVSAAPASPVLADGGSTTFTVEFTPGAAGMRSATISIGNDDPGSNKDPYDFAITGTGTIVAAPEISVSGNATSITDGDPSPSLGNHTDFGATAIVGGLVARTFTIQNIGTNTLDIVGVAITGTNAASFAVTQQPPSTLAASGNTTFVVQFDPSTAGLKSATIEIQNSDADEGNFDFAIRGNGTETTPDIRVVGNGNIIANGDFSPDSSDWTDFGSQMIGSVTDTIFQVLNDGSGNLNIAGAVTISGSPDFTIIAQPASPITTGISFLTIRFTPSDTSLRTATVEIASDDPNDSPYEFSIQGAASSAGGSITIIQKINGPDRRVNFTSATTALNLSLTTVSGSAQSSAIIVAAGIHTITAADLGGAGYGISAIYCDDINSSGDTNTRSATINLSAGETVTCTFETIASRAVTVAMLGDFLGARNTLLMNNQPDIARRLDRLNPDSQAQGTASVTALGFTASIPAPVDIQLSQNLLSYAASSRAIMGAGEATYPDINKWDIWTEGTVALFDTRSGQSGSMGVVHAGVDYLVTEDVLVGLRAQVDWMNQDFTATSGNVNGTGWMAGPYAIVRLDENFYFDVSATWGTSINSISPFGTYVDEFTTTRWMINGGLVGQFMLENWTIRPTVTFTYVDEYQYAYTDSLNVPIPGQNVSQGAIRFGPRVSYSNQLENGALLVPWVEVSGVYNFVSTLATNANSLSAAMQGITGSIEAGIDLTTIEGGMINLSGQYDGIGSNAQVFGLRLGLSAPLD
jgi:Autotransporter beta-domain/HYDIN/CFA65/VesB-like, Ig-like domain